MMTGTFRFTPIAAAALIATAAFFPVSIAFAQTVQLPPVRGYPVQEPERPSTTRPLREGVTDLGDTQGVIVQPRFIVEAISFTAFSGPPREPPFRNTLAPSWPVFAVFESGNHKLVTRTYNGIRTGDTVTFPAAQNCVWAAIDPDGQENGVWACDSRGRAGPIQFTMMLWAERPGGGNIFGDFCVNTQAPGDLSGCYYDHHEALFRHTFSYEVSDILNRLDPSCLCFTETASDDRSNREYRITFRITRVDDGGEPLGVDRSPPGSMAPVVHRSGTLTVLTTRDLEFDAGTVVDTGGDFSFTRSGSYFLTPVGGAKIWSGGPTARDYPTCYAQRMSANYVTTQIPLPAVGSYACYVTSDGRVGEFRVQSVTPSPLGGASATLVVSYTTWQ